MIDPERLDLESASSAYRRRRCAGSVNLVRELRERGTLRPRADSDAQSGTRVHQAWCGMEVSLSPRERDTLESLKRMEAMLVTDWAGAEQVVCLGREVRLWLHERLEPIHSGAFDVAYGTLGTPGRMLIIDGKTLFGEVTPAEENDQLRELVALARANFGACAEFTVAILQPWVSKRPSVAVYDLAEAELSLRLLKLTLAECADPDAVRTPGAWCKHCPARSNCEEARALVGHSFALAKRIEAGEFALPLGEKGTRFLDSIQTARTVLEAMRDAYKAILLEQSDAVPFYYMKEGKKVREIRDVPAALELAQNTVTLSEFLGALTLNVGALEDVVGARLGLNGKRKTERFNELFCSVLSLKQYGPELTRASERKARDQELAAPAPAAATKSNSQ